MSTSLRLSVAGIIFELIFEDTEFGLGKNLLLRDIKKYYRGFIVKNNQGPDHTIIFHDQMQIPLLWRGKDEYALLSKKISSKKTVCLYNFGLPGFQIVFRRILQNILTKNNGFMLHASANNIGGIVCIFTAPSGGGKSTIMRLLNSSFPAIADDSIIIRYNNNLFSLYQTPFFETNSWFTRSSHPFHLGKLFLLHKDKLIRNHAEENKSLLLEKLIPQLWTDGHDINKQTQLLIKFVKSQPIYNLYFPKNKKIVQAFFSEKNF